MNDDILLKYFHDKYKNTNLDLITAYISKKDMVLEDCGPVKKGDMIVVIKHKNHDFAHNFNFGPVPVEES